ncbi:MAG: DUF72 domain-containing protein [Pseudomonadota bacterium]
MPDARGRVFCGCAGWSLPPAAQHAFGAGNSHLSRYATRLNAAEINSSFYRPHSRATYARWAASVPAAFRFSVKLPKAITHDARLRQSDSLLPPFFEQIEGLEDRLGCLLVQLPPSLAFDSDVAAGFFRNLRAHCSAQVALEPRHASWFSPGADALMVHHGVARVLADPVLFGEARMPGGCPGLVYLRLHGSPRRYYSPYTRATLEALAARIEQARSHAREIWCIFDNTASGAATDDALQLRSLLSAPKGA